MTLKELFTNIANAIRSKTGSSATIKATDFATQISNIKLATGNATTSQVLSGYTFSNASGNGLTGAMTNRGTWTSTISPGGSVTIPAGYHNGSGKVSASNYKYINRSVNYSTATDGNTTHTISNVPIKSGYILIWGTGVNCLTSDNKSTLTPVSGFTVTSNLTTYSAGSSGFVSFGVALINVTSTTIKLNISRNHYNTTFCILLGY